MKNGWRVSLLLVLGFLLSTAWRGDWALAAEKNMAVGVGVGISQGKMSSTKPFVLKDAKGKKISVGTSVTFSCSGKHLNTPKGKLLLPVTAQGPAPIVWDKHPYRGVLRIVPSTKGGNVINVLSVEDYLRGVLKMEANPAWHMEALRAQAIVARTFALRNLGRHRSQGFDLCATTHCQVYRGINAEDPRTDKAVAATRGMVLAAGKDIALTAYHSDSGGATANVQDVWGGNIPYLKGQPEPVAYTSPNSTWQLVLSPGQVEDALERIDVRVGAVRELAVSQKDAFGRAVRLDVRGSGGNATVSAHKFRMAVGPSTLRSTVFEVGFGAAGAPVPPTPGGEDLLVEDDTPLVAESVEEGDLLITLTRQGAFTTDELMDMLMHPETRPQHMAEALARGGRPVKAVPRPSQAPDRTLTGKGFVFQGRGWGHGLGMSQWGAKALADTGWSAEKILGHYFPGTRLKVIY